MEEKKKNGKSGDAKDGDDTQTEKKRKLLTWLIGGAGVVVAALMVLAIFIKKPVNPSQPGVADSTLNKQEEVAKTDSTKLDTLPLLQKEDQQQTGGLTGKEDSEESQAQATEKPEVQAQTTEKPKDQAQTGEPSTGEIIQKDKSGDAGQNDPQNDADSAD